MQVRCGIVIAFDFIYPNSIIPTPQTRTAYTLFAPSGCTNAPQPTPPDSSSSTHLHYSICTFALLVILAPFLAELSQQPRLLGLSAIFELL